MAQAYPGRFKTIIHLIILSHNTKPSTFYIQNKQSLTLYLITTGPNAF